MPEQRYVEVTEPLTDFTGCVLSTDKDNAVILHPNGKVECPPAFGDWTGWVEFVNDPEGHRHPPAARGYRGYLLHFDGPVSPMKLKIYHLVLVEN